MKCYKKHGGEAMTIKYDLEKLQAILRDYTRITGLSIAVLDREFQQIAVAHSQESGFCQSIQNSELGKDKCRCSDRDLLERCAQTQRAEFHVCHAGLTDAAIPLIKDGIIIGYVLLGRIRRSVNMDSICDRLDWMHMGQDLLNESFRSLTYYDDQQMQSVINLASAITTYILVDDMVKMEYNQDMERAVTYIRENLNGDLSVEGICTGLSISKNLLYDLFRRGMNTTVGEYVTHCRMERAKELLRDTPLPLTAVADAVGIENYTYFIKLFKKRTGVTPLQYRKQN